MMAISGTGLSRGIAEVAVTGIAQKRLGVDERETPAGGGRRAWISLRLSSGSFVPAVALPLAFGSRGSYGAANEQTSALRAEACSFGTPKVT